MMKYLVIAATLSAAVIHSAVAFSSARQSATRSIGTTLRSSDVSEEVLSSSSTSSSVRPLHQNWWPVTTVSALDKTRPNGIELLNKRLVLWNSGEDGASGGWSCMDDRCSHRFAPLSEGRIVSTDSEEYATKGSTDCATGGKKNCLQCAYHGWQFNDEGSCTLVPQAPKQTSAALPVKSYPVREAAGLIWVWSDPNSESFSLAESIDLPISPLVRRFLRYDDSTTFMRDLPYGMEILGENLIDLSHLPFSHHGVGQLDRKDEKIINIRKLSYSEREERARKEAIATSPVDTDENGVGVGIPSHVVPLIQGEVVDAWKSDPIFIPMAKNPAMGVTDSATTTTAFYDPCHVRYHRNPSDAPGRATNVELFMCPTATGKSRVFLMNTMEAFLPKASDKETADVGFIQKRLNALKQLKPDALKARLIKAIVRRKFAGWRGHMISHAIFDGDGIFLHKQGDRMARESLTYKDYSTPSSADVLVNSYRRWLQSCAAKTLDCDELSFEEKEKIVNAATAASNPYDDSLARSTMLDRYDSHTKNCKICSEAVAKFERKKEMMSIANVAMIGASGASGILALTLGVLSMSGASFGGPLLRALGLSFAGSLAGVYGTHKQKGKIHDLIQQFYFEDYIHAEKN